MKNTSKYLSGLIDELKKDKIPSRISERGFMDNINNLLNNIYDGLSPSLEKFYSRKLPKIKFVATPIWDLSAFVTKETKKEEYSVGVSIGAIMLIDLFNALRWSLGASVEDYLASQDKNTDTVWEKFGSIAHRYSTRRYYDLRHWYFDPTVGGIIPIGYWNIRTSTGLVNEKYKDAQAHSLDLMIMFIISHEVAHIMSGHLSNEEDTVGLTFIDGETKRIRKSNIGYKSEFEADILAVKLLCSIEKYGISRVLMNIAFFFRSLDLIERISLKSIFWGHSHPNIKERLNNIKSNIDDIIKSQNYDLNKALLIINSYSDIPEVLGLSINEDISSYRISPFILKDFQEYPNLDRLLKSAESNNMGDLLLGASDENAKLFYLSSLDMILDIPYGDGHRIVYNNLVCVCFNLGEYKEGCDYAIKGLSICIENNDKPSLILFIKKLKKHINEHKANVSIIKENLSEFLNSIKKEYSDPLINSYLDSILRIIL